MPPIPPQAIQAGAQAAGAIVSGVTSLIQAGRARRLERQNKRPDYNIPTEIAKNQRIAETMANTGLPQEQYNAAMRNINRNQAAGVSVLLDRRSALPGVSTITQRTNDATLKLDVTNATTRINNQKTLMQTNATMASFKDKAWEWNQRRRFEETAAAIRALRGASNANLNYSINTLMGAGASAFGSGIFDKNTSSTQGDVRMWNIPGAR